MILRKGKFERSVAKFRFRGLIPLSLSGLIAGLLGAIVWIAIAMVTGYEIGVFAIGVGALAGLGVRIPKRGTTRGSQAGVALLACVLSLVVAKTGYAIVSWPGRNPEEVAVTRLSGVVAREYVRAGKTFYVQTGKLGIEYPEEIRVEAIRRWNALPLDERTWYMENLGYAYLIDGEELIARIGLDIAEQYEARGIPVDWPESSGGPNWKEDFPTDIWEEAVARWEAFSPEEQHDFQQRAAIVFVIMTTLEHVAAVFSPWDILWCGLAMAIAWRVGSGGGENGRYSSVNDEESDLRNSITGNNEG